MNFEALSESEMLPERQSELNIDCLRSSSTFNQLETIWRTLERIDTQCMPFSTWSWLNSWWNQLGAKQQCKLRIFVVKKGKEVVAIAPMIITNRKPLPLLTLSTLEFMGNIPGAVTPHYGVIAQPRYRAAAEKLILRQISKLRGWQMLSLQNLSENSSLAQALREHQNYDDEIEFREDQDSIPQITLPRSWSEYRQGGELRAAQLKSLNKQLNQLGECELSITSTKEDFSEALSAYTRLCVPLTEQQSKTEVNNGLAEADEFLRNVVENYFSSDQLWQVTLKIDSDIVGVQHYFLWRGYLVLIQEAFTPELKERQASQFMLAYSINRGFRQGIRRVCIANSYAESVDQFVDQKWRISEFRYTQSKVKRLLEPLLRK